MLDYSEQESSRRLHTWVAPDSRCIPKLTSFTEIHGMFLSGVPLELHGCMILLHSSSLNTTDPRFMQDYLNLLTMTAIIKSTSTVMIAIVTILFVAILVTRQHKSLAQVTTNSVNTFAPCLSASCCSCPCIPRSQVGYLLYAQ